MLTLHHLEESRSTRTLWLLEELGADYEIKRYARTKAGLAPDELKQVHPLGKSPVITDGDITVAESGVITEYLIDKYGKGQFKPRAGSPEASQNNYWMHYAEGSLMPLMLLTIVFNRVEQAPFIVRPIAKAISGQVKKGFINPNIKTHLAYVDQALAGKDFFCGDELSGADFQMIIPLNAARSNGFTSNSPNIEAYLDRVHARPAFKAALERGG